MTTYTRRAYEDTAALLTEERTATEHTTKNDEARRVAVAVLEDLARRFGRIYSADNERFDLGRFLRACGINEDKDTDDQEQARRNLEKVARRNAGLTGVRE